MSFIGIGVPAFFSSCFICPKNSAVSMVTSIVVTVGFSRKRVRYSLFCCSFLPPLNPACSSPTTIADSNTCSAFAITSSIFSSPVINAL